MTLRNFLLAGLSGSTLFAAGALAADLPVRGPAPAPAPIFVVSNWNGFYIGANIGYGFGTGDVVGVRYHPPVQGNFQGNTGNAKSSGVFGGIQAGYNMQFNQFVVGVEADAQLSGMRGSANGVLPDASIINTRAGNNWFGTLRLRAGYLVNPNLLIYGTGGVALTEVKYNWAGTGAFAGVLSQTNQRVGWTAGIGAEYMIDRNWSVKAEGLYVDTGKKTIFNTTNSASTIETQSFWAVRLGVNYRFGSTGPVVAKY